MSSITDGSFSVEEKVKILMKKNLGKASTTADRNFYEEIEFNARAGVFQSQVYSLKLPETGWEAMGYNNKNEWDAAKENFGNNTPHHSGDSPISYYHKYDLKSAILGEESQKYSFIGKTVDGVDNILRNAIPTDFAKDNSYKIVVEDSDDNILAGGDAGGEWFLDNDAGVLTFFEYDSVKSRVVGGNPNINDGAGLKFPKVSFFRYNGQLGSGWEVKDKHMSSTSNSLVIGKKYGLTDAAPYNLDVSGTARFSSTVKAQEFEAESDVMLKHEIKPIEDTLSKLDKIKGVSFKWNNI